MPALSRILSGLALVITLFSVTSASPLVLPDKVDESPAITITALDAEELAIQPFGMRSPPDRDNLYPNELSCEYSPGKRVKTAGIYAHIDAVCFALKNIYLEPRRIWRARAQFHNRKMEWHVSSYKASFHLNERECIDEMRIVQHRCANYASMGKPSDERGFYGGWKTNLAGNLLTLIEIK